MAVGGSNCCRSAEDLQTIAWIKVNERVRVHITLQREGVVSRLSREEEGAVSVAWATLRPS